ncbi:NAD(P)/FAD-dependent oxidoreductase (plasmid) [Thioclava sp. 'Guangxiensis']|uniref:FAD/NAD(P)-dependent oxidoreductase n=1 Tax=Thioclava sp. 'Guangxiensis' TaxID=3149044 RepID=UPI0032C47DC6
MTTTIDLCIIGAGPAGMAAAIEACALGLSVLVLDEAADAGGQIWRDIARATSQRLRSLGPDYAKGRVQYDVFKGCGCDYRPSSTVWHIEALEPGFKLSVSGPAGSYTVDATRLLVATGALERPMPLPGWTLPGVTTAGALQILLKSSSVVAPDAVLVGAGPLLYLIASQMVAAGQPPRAIVETVPKENWRKALPHVPRALGALGYLRKGLAMKRVLARAGVPIHKDARDITLEGADALEAVSFTSGGRRQRILTTSAALHHGVIPNAQITRLMRCDHHWDAGQHCFRPVLDDWGETSCKGLYVAGDGGGIFGAASAVLSGRIAAIGIARAAGKFAGNAVPLRTALARDARIRPFLETLYAPAAQALVPQDDTLICRCEEITAGRLRAAISANAPGPNQLKSFLRVGMGPCQGRVCGLAVTQMIVNQRGIAPDQAGYFRIRPPLKPLSLSELAAINPDSP